MWCFSMLLLCLGLGVAAIAREKSPRPLINTPRNVMRDLWTTPEFRPNHPTPANINLAQDLRKNGKSRAAHSNKRNRRHNFPSHTTEKIPSHGFQKKGKSRAAHLKINKSHDFRVKGKSRPDYPIQSLQNTHKSLSAPLTAWNISLNHSFCYNKTFGKRKWQDKLYRLYSMSPEWLPHFCSKRDVRPKWEKESDCLYNTRVFTRPYPNDCYKHTCQQITRRGCPYADNAKMKEVFYEFWKDIRGDLMFTFDYILRFSDPEYRQPIHSFFWYLIAYLQTFVIRIQYPVNVATSANTESSDMKSAIDAMINEYKDALADLWIRVEDQILRIKIIIDGGCPDNQEFKQCPDPCEPQTCKESYEGVDPSCKNKTCKPECRCKPSYFLNKDKECVLKEDCVLCPSHQVPECPSKCPPRQCSRVLSGHNGCKAGPVDLTCKTLPVCQCAPGLYSSDKGQCVDPFMCPNVCPKDQTVEMCPHKCNLRHCNDSFPETPCPPTPPDPCPKPACVCAGNLYLNEDSKCVAKKHCLDCPINEVPECPNSCHKQCVNANWTDNCVPKEKYPDCTSKPECNCNRTGGFYKHYNKCILKHECRTNGNDRESLACTDRAWCAERTAASYVSPDRSSHKDYCPTNFYALAYCRTIPSLHCKYPYVRKDGSCVRFTEILNCTFGNYSLEVACEEEGCEPQACNKRITKPCNTSARYLADCTFLTCQCTKKDEYLRYISKNDRRCYTKWQCDIDSY